MYTRIVDVYNLYKNRGLKLIAGDKGMENRVQSCGILDYEYEESVGDRYSYKMFLENQLVITSFMYAKDNEFLIMNALRNLKNRGCSGLIIKNVFKIKIREHVIRYADTMNFPVFISDNSSMFFEDIIINVHNLVAREKEMNFGRKQMDLLLRSEVGSDQWNTILERLNPSLYDNYFILYLQTGYLPDPVTVREAENVLIREKLLEYSDCFFAYKTGVMLICSRISIKEDFVADYVDNCQSLITDLLSVCHIGVSSIKHQLEHFKEGVYESLQTASFAMRKGIGLQFWDKLGIYKAIIPYARKKPMKHFAYSYMKPLLEYDAEYQTKLVQTAYFFVEAGGHIPETSELMKCHQNTVRNRLMKINEILDCNVLERKTYEELMLAVKICDCAEDFF
ncbi:MAG: PucR family transcriptional regulator [Eubacterium sp.]|nr:PucR family transcriptional regulator [Eubacterium sp.]